MSYAERAYFAGDHCAHVAAWQEARWLQDRRQRAAEAVRRVAGWR